MHLVLKMRLFCDFWHVYHLIIVYVTYAIAVDFLYFKWNGCNVKGCGENVFQLLFECFKRIFMENYKNCVLQDGNHINVNWSKLTSID